MAAKSLPERDLAKELYRNGLEVSEIAKRINVRYQTIYQWRRREKWDCQPRKTHESQAVAIKTVAEEFANRAITIARQVMCKLETEPLRGVKDCKETATALAAAYATARKALGQDDHGSTGRVNVTVYQGSVLVSSGDAGDAGQVIDVTCEPSENKAQVVDSVQVNHEQTLTDIVRKPTQAVD